MQAAAVLIILAVAAWTPPAMWPPAAAAAGLCATLLLFHRTPAAPALPGRLLAPPALWLLVGLSTGWDRGQALLELALAGIVLAVLTAASHRAPRDRDLLVFGLIVSPLALWGLWQVVIGFDAARQALVSLPEGLRAAARFRLDTGRAFASQAHPGHLAVLMTTVVAVAAHGLLQGRRRAPWMLALGLAGLGLLLTRSPLGLGLCVLVLATVAGGRRGTPFSILLGAALVLFTVVLFLRPDLLVLQPLVWRLENWHNALWVWSRSPVTGVGLGGFGQAALAVPFTVANHPQHVHCLPLEWLAEMGIPGLALALLFYAWIATVARRIWHRQRGLAVAFLVIPLHNLVDFSLFEPGIAVVWAVLAGWALAVAAGDGEHRRGPSSRLVPVVAALLGAAVFALTFASTSAGRPNPDGDRSPAALEAEVRAFRLAPWRPLPLSLARSVDSAGAAESAALSAALAEARWWRPHSAALASISSRLARRTGDLPSAAREGWAAEIFTPLDRRPVPPPQVDP